MKETLSEGEITRAARPKTESDVSELRRRIPPLRTKHNELALISILPPEVLSNIFVHVRDLSTIHRPSIGHLALWIHVGHICHHWREIALNCPDLWSIPVFARPNLAQEMIQRSKMAPLTIRSTGTLSTKVLEQLEKALAQTTRIQSIELGLIGGYAQRLEGTFPLLSQPTPLLERLSLYDPTYSKHISFPPDALSYAPRLRSVNLDGLVFNWGSAMFKHTALTDLRLTGSPSGTSTGGQMMDALHHLPNLRILVLNTSLPPYLASGGSMRTVEFKFLQQLELGAIAVNCIFFLRHIQYPSSTTIKLNSYLTSVEDGMTTISLLGQNSCSVQSTEAKIQVSPVIRSARLTQSDHSLIEIAFFNGIDNINQPCGMGGLDPVVLMRFDSGSDSFTEMQGRFLTTVTNSFNLSSLEEVLLDWSFTSNHIRAIRESVGKLPKLKVINISQSPLDICIALAGTNRGEKSKSNPTHDPTQGQEASQHSLPVFPALETLIVRVVDFRQRQQPHPEIIDHLLDMLIKRSNFNAPIDTLRLEQCHEVRTWQIRLLGEFVAHLEVDGKVIDVRELETGWSDEGDSSDEDDGDRDEDENDEL